jgi:hypothetical protein
VIGADVQAGVALLRAPGTIRARCENVLARGLAGGLRHFAIDLDRLPAAVELVASVTRERYPDLRVPPHSRWRHFGAGGVDRAARLHQAFARRPADARARACIDLVVVSVLLDAGAGAAWRYRERQTGLDFSRSEGLAVATFRMFESGLFSDDPADPWRADAAALEAMDDDALAAAFQVSAEHPMSGLAGRAGLMRKLGAALRRTPEVFGRERARIGSLLDAVRCRAIHDETDAAVVLELVLAGLETIWPHGATLDGCRLGDAWPHHAAGGDGPTAGIVPFHKLSQWLTYSLIEPLEDAGVTVTGVDQLTGLAEYRNGGLFVDLGVLVPKHAGVTSGVHAPEAEVVVEWRALTVALLDRLAPRVAHHLGLTPRALPLASVLEGGTWAAGRRLAEERRGGAPPIQVLSDGTIF